MKETNLHSTIFILKHAVALLRCGKLKYLHSTIFILKQFLPFAEQQLNFVFTFYYIYIKTGNTQIPQNSTTECAILSHV